MSSMTQPGDAGAPERVMTPGRPVEAGAWRRFWISFALIGLVLAFSVVEVLNLSLRHTVGAELYGVVAAIVSAAAAILSMALLASRRRRVLASAAVLILWAIVALGGLAGTYYHIVGVAPEYGPVDPRPRPVAAPLIFTAFGLAGGVALFYGQRLGSVRVRIPGKE